MKTYCLAFSVDTEDPGQLRQQVGRGMRPAADLVSSSVLDKEGHHTPECDSRLKTVLCHTLTVGHEWQGRGWQEKSQGRCLPSDTAHSSG